LQTRRISEGPKQKPPNRRRTRRTRRVLRKEKKRTSTTMHHIQGCEKNALGRSISCGRNSRETKNLEIRFNQQTNKQKVQLQLLHQQNKTTSFQTLKTLHPDKKKKKKKKKSVFGTGEREITGV
jgi:glucose-6-phosphate isomerase